MNEKINIMITGENGYIGSELCKHLQKSGGFNVDIVSLMDDNWKSIDFSKYDTIVHLAAIVHKPKTQKEVYKKVNYELTVELAKKAKKENVKQFIFFSTASVYGNIQGKITKDTKENPNNFYGESKLKAEKKLQEMQDDEFKICILRPPMVYGKDCKGNYCTLSKIAKKTPIFPKLNNQRSMIYIENLCEFIKLIILNNESGIFYPQNKEFINTSKMVKIIADENRHKILITKMLNPFVFIGKYIPGKIGNLCNKAFGDLYYDISMSEYKQNYNIKTFEESIHETEC